MNELSKYSTKELVEELQNREAVQHLWVEPYESISINIGQQKQDLHITEGPGRILCVYD